MTNNIAPCIFEDGSSEGQVFPCHWDASIAGNGTGDSYTLFEAGGVPTYDLAPTPEVITEVGTAAPDPVQLAHTGIDPTGALVATLAIVAGIALTLVRRFGRVGA